MAKKKSSMRARFNILFCETPVMSENPKGCLSMDLDLAPENYV
jgi:hypothetical protein